MSVQAPPSSYVRTSEELPPGVLHEVETSLAAASQLPSDEREERIFAIIERHLLPFPVRASALAAELYTPNRKAAVLKVLLSSLLRAGRVEDLTFAADLLPSMPWRSYDMVRNPEKDALAGRLAVALAKIHTVATSQMVRIRALVHSIDHRQHDFHATCSEVADAFAPEFREEAKEFNRLINFRILYR